jgi:hypothetical protein
MPVHYRMLLPSCFPQILYHDYRAWGMCIMCAQIGNGSYPGTLPPFTWSTPRLVPNPTPKPSALLFGAQGDWSSITPLQQVQSCFLTYLQVLLIQSFGSQTSPLSFLLYVKRDSLLPFLKCQPDLIKSSSPSSVKNCGILNALYYTFCGLTVSKAFNCLFVMWPEGA